MTTPNTAFRTPAHGFPGHDGCAALAAWLASSLDAQTVRIAHGGLMPGGAVQENHAIDLFVHGGPRAGCHRLVLRTDAATGLGIGCSRTQEFEVHRTAHAAGVATPEPWLACADPTIIGKPFYLMQREVGETRGRLLVRDNVIRQDGGLLLRELGAQLGRLHRVRPAPDRLNFLPCPSDAALERIESYRSWLDRMGRAEPVLEWALRWLELNRPSPSPPVLCHGDFRTGNFLVRDGRLIALLDWEFAAWSDPLEDIGWLAGRYWRFGREQDVAGGLGSLETFLEGYDAHAPGSANRALLPYWEVLGIVRWAVIALMQAARFHVGGERSLDLALTGLVLPELEMDLLEAIGRIDQIPA